MPIGLLHKGGSMLNIVQKIRDFLAELKQDEKEIEEREQRMAVASAKIAEYYANLDLDEHP